MSFKSYLSACCSLTLCSLFLMLTLLISEIDHSYLFHHLFNNLSH